VAVIDWIMLAQPFLLSAHLSVKLDAFAATNTQVSPLHLQHTLLPKLDARAMFQTWKRALWQACHAGTVCMLHQ
jgi:hypothetical protein